MSTKHTRSLSTPLPSPALPPTTTPPTQSTTTPTRQLRPRKPLKIDIAIAHLRFRLHPLHPLPSGPVHPSFPATLLSYNLLTEVQLDALARHYHQAPHTPRSRRQPGYAWPSIWTEGYPAQMRWDEEWLASLEDVERRVGIKRRKWGRFIGLRGCETPRVEVEERERWRVKREEGRSKVEGWDYWGRTRF